MLKMLFLLIASAIFTPSKAGDADPHLPMTPEVAPRNGNGYAYAYTGGWPDIFPDNTFLGGSVPVGDFLENLKKQQEKFESDGTFVASFSSSSGTSKSQAQSSITFSGGENGNILNWASDAMARGGPFPAQIPKNLQRDAEGVYAGGIIAPSGVYQTAQLFPENPGSPNIETRFAVNNPSPDGSNFYAVAASSQSGSQTVDGKTTGFRKATTTVNDNGKVTSYTVQDP